MVGGHLRGVGEHGDGQRETFTWEAERKAGGWHQEAIHNSLKPSSSRRAGPLSCDPGAEERTLGELQAAGLGIQGPLEACYPFDHLFPLPCVLATLVYLFHFSAFALFPRDSQDFGVGS